MEKIIIDNVLDAIHYTLKRSGFTFSGKQLSRADEFITSYISELDIDSKEFTVKTVGAPKLVHDRRVIPLVVKYFAYLEDNIGLYNELIDDGYIFSEGPKIRFYALDRLVTGNFKRNEYKNLLSKDEEALSSFYYSLREIEDDKKEQCAKDFSDIVHIDHTTLTVGNNGESGISHYNYLTGKNILLLGKDFLLKIGKEQRNIINNISFNYNEKDALKIKELFTKYPSFNGIPISIEILHNFSIDEISTMNIKDYVLYKVALKNNLFDRIKQILESNSSFDCPKGFIREEVFRVLTNEEIISLSSDAKDKIANLEIPKIDNVLVMPIKKIRSIAFKDKIHEKIESIKGSSKK